MNYNFLSKYLLPFASCGLMMLFILLSLGLACTTEEGQDITIEVLLEADGHKITMAPAIISVNQDSMLTLNVTSPIEGKFHIHGYDIASAVGSQPTTRIAFRTIATGRYGITLHTTCKATISTEAEQPKVRITIEPSERSGSVDVHIDTENFVLGLETGHYHLYIDGEMQGMFATPDITVNLGNKGEHQIMAVLSNTSHCEYGIRAITSFVLDPTHEHEETGDQPHVDANEVMDGHQHEGMGSEVTLGYLEVYPK